MIGVSTQVAAGDEGFETSAPTRAGIESNEPVHALDQCEKRQTPRHVGTF